MLHGDGRPAVADEFLVGHGPAGDLQRSAAAAANADDRRAHAESDDLAQIVAARDLDASHGWCHGGAGQDPDVRGDVVERVERERAASAYAVDLAEHLQ